MSQKGQNNTLLSGIDISTIETKISEELLLATEELIDTDTIISLIEINKGSYETVVEERSIRYETQVNLVSNQIKTQQCNCIPWQSQGSCKHIIAAIFAIRSHIANQVIAANKKKKRASRRSASIDVLINQIPTEELQQFIKTYARKDRVFKLLLQARFVSFFSDEELAAFVESSFPILTKANEKVTPKQISVFLQVVEILEQQFKAYISHKDYIDGYRLIFLILRKSFYIKSKLKTERPKFDIAHGHLINNYLETLNLIEAPEYKEFLYMELKELLGTSYISANTPEEHLLWISIYRDKSKHEMLLDLIIAYNNHNHLDVDSGYFMKMIEILMSSSDKRLETILEGDLQVAYRILQLLQRYKVLDQAPETMQSYFIHKRLSSPLAKSILPILPQSGDQLVIDACINYYIRFKQDEYLNWIKENSKNWEETSSKMLEMLRSKNDSFLEVQFHFANDDLPAAVTVIKDDNSWNLITLFDEHIFTIDPNLSIDIYKHHLRDYLSQHFGLKSKDYTQVVFQRIYKIGREKARRALADFIKEEFGQRGLY